MAAARGPGLRSSSTRRTLQKLILAEDEGDAYWEEGKTVLRHLSGGGPGALDGLTALQTLDLKEQKGLTSLPSLDGLKALQTLDPA